LDLGACLCIILIAPWNVQFAAMKFFLFTALIWSAWAIVLLVAAGYFFVRRRWVVRKNARRSSVLAASATAAIGMAFTQHSQFPLEYTSVDIFAWFAAAWVVSLGAFWGGISMAARKDGYHFHHDFGESSMLSMQYVDSVEHPQFYPDSDFLKTQEMGHEVKVVAPNIADLDRVGERK
jgi:hypothetical protein